MTKLYGVSTVLGFPCICYGKKGYFFTIRWTKKYKWFRIYNGPTTAEEVLRVVDNTSGWWFIGMMVNTKEE